MSAELDNKDREELENLKTENARLSELVKVLEEQIESLNTRLRARTSIGEKGYFSHYYHCFSDLNECRFGVLQDVIDSEHPYDNGKNQYDFFLPERYIINSEKQFRPYTLNEFLDKYTVCANIRIRQRDRTYQYFGKLIGYGFPTDPNTGKQVSVVIVLS